MRETVILSTEKKRLKSGREVEYWICRWHDSRGKYRSKSLGRKNKLTHKQARKKAVTLQVEFEKNAAIRSSKRLTLKELAETFIEFKKTRWSKSSLKRNKNFLGVVIDFFGEKTSIDSIRRLDATQLETALSKRQGRTGNAERNTINCYLRIACAMFKFAVENELLMRNPFQSMVTAARVAPWVYVSPDEFTRIMSELPEKFKLVFALCRLAGLRKEEAMNLQWRDINFQNNRIHVCTKDGWQPKRGKERFVPICPELQSYLLEAFQDAQDGAVSVFGFRFYSQDYDRIRAARERAEVKFYGRPFHTLRKSYITDMANKYPMHVVKEIAGHSKIEITAAYYLKVSDEQYHQATQENLFRSVSNSVVSSLKTV